MSTMIPTRQCRKRLAIAWFVLGGFLILLMILMSLLGKFGGRTSEAWGWFLPALMPTLSLIVGVLVIDLRSESSKCPKHVDRFLYLLALWLSLGYLLAIALTFLAQPLVNTPILDLMQLTDLWLGPLQGIVAAALGVFFLRGEEVLRRTERQPPQV